MRTMIFLAATGLALASCGPTLLSKAPEPGTLPHNEVVYVDDGNCPAGQVSKHTEGNNNLGINRKIECVPRPE